MSAPFRLKVQKLNQIALFELSWGQGQQLESTLDYPMQLTVLYQEWQRVYLSFYKTAQMPLSPSVGTGVETPLRGWAIAGGQVTPEAVDWHAKLVEAEIKLLREFHRWLRSAELFEIRATIARASREVAALDRANGSNKILVFLTCPSIELARFPWEAWEIGTDFATTGTIQIVRTPATIRGETGNAQVQRRRGRIRILAILGDETGLNFQADRSAVQALARTTEVQFVGWQPGQTAAEVKTHISQAIVDAAGWDVLFFAGHSNETAMTGGELGIAPGTGMQIAEIAPQLAIAKARGLQVAIFNSCSGLQIAESLIDLGFSQVAVMREPIHNRVAEEFLVQFLRNLAAYRDVHDSLLAACQFLRLEKNLTYPSAYLVPSLFCHPGAKLFRIQPFGWKQRLQQGLPTRMEAIALAAGLVLSLIPQVQEFLLDQRIGVQAAYRDLTGQVPPPALPPVTLVHIDEESVGRDLRVSKQPSPISRSYLADLIHHLSDRNAKIIGIDYLLDRQVGEEPILRKAIQSAVQQQQSWVVFGTLFNEFEAQNRFVTEESRVAEPTWSLQGYVSVLPQFVTLPYPEEDCRQSCPFGYLLSLIHIASQDKSLKLPYPHLDSRTDLRTQSLNAMDRISPKSAALQALRYTHLTPLAGWCYEMLGLTWFHPVIDYSIPLDRVYRRIPAWKLFDSSLELPQLSQQVVLIGAGGYTDGGAVNGELDLYPVPTAMRYWQNHLQHSSSENSFRYLSKLSGVEVHAFIIHHLLTQRLVTSIPDALTVAIAVVLGKSIAAGLQQQQRRQWTRKQQRQFITGLAIATTLYGLVGLQLYITAALLLPWVLPSLVFWAYVLPTLRRQANA